MTRIVLFSYKLKKENLRMNNKTETTHEVKRTYKDSVFVTIFHDKAKLIELYNALFDTNYDESAPIDIVTIKDVLFRTLKNEEDALQLIVKVYNINTEKNSEILKKCETLRQYSRFVEIMRSYREDSELTNDVIVEVLDKCRKEGILTEFLDKYGTEIVEMLFKELTREEDLEISRLDGYEEGERAGFTKGERAGAERGAKQKQCEIAKSLRESGIPIDVIAKNTGLSEKEIAEL